MVFIILVLMIAIGIGLAVLSSTEIFISGGNKSSDTAYRYALGSAQDALLRISRDKTYACSSVDCYSIDFVTNGCSTNAGCGRISVSTGLGTTLDPKIITAKGQVGNKARRLQVTVVLDTASNGEITSTTWEELTN